jgi:hypothetical protein
VLHCPRCGVSDQWWHASSPTRSDLYTVLRVNGLVQKAFLVATRVRLRSTLPPEDESCIGSKTKFILVHILESRTYDY